ncbi:MAG: hypothetical protein LC114_27380 [Bryobacterales bacterium]|nr:hypothetical protein [Bryobacterales bacterium]
MRIVASLAFVLSHLAVPSAFAAEYASVGQLMLQALDAPGGTAHGVIVGPVAKKFRDTTGSVAPVMAEVTTLKSFRQEGCKRLNVRLKQANVPTTDGKLTEFGFDYGLNCAGMVARRVKGWTWRRREESWIWAVPARPPGWVASLSCVHEDSVLAVVDSGWL